MSQLIQSSLSGYYTRAVAGMQRLRRARNAMVAAASTSELLTMVEGAMLPAVLTRAVNALQHRLWHLPSSEQEPLRNQLLAALTHQVLCAVHASVRLEAARWLRLFTQASMTSRPQDIFVTLVTSALRLQDEGTEQDLLAMLTLILECFWPFRSPYAAYHWQQLPGNAVFLPLLSLLQYESVPLQEILIAIFSELLTLDEPQITELLLPVALAWSNHADGERRRSVTRLLALISTPQAHDALQRLQYDADPVVCASARHAADYTRHP